MPPANSARLEELRESLRQQLAEEAVRKSFGPKDRVLWLSNRTGEYLDRWLGFCAASEARMPDLVNSVLFAAVEIGAELLDSELYAAAPHSTALASCRRFRDALAALHQGGQREDAATLNTLLSECRASVHSLVS